MKAITLTQPWATLVAIGAKHIETRSWATSHRGPLAIHAGKGLGPVSGIRGLHDLYYSSPFYDVLFPRYGALSEWDIPLGAIVATCDLIDCVPTKHIKNVKIIRHGDHEWLWTENEKAFGDYTPGRFAWLLANVRPLPEPIPAKGALSLWEWNQ